MSTTSSKTSGCSACLVAAIEHRDNAAVRRMLADQTVQYADIVWLPLPLGSLFHAIDRVLRPLFRGYTIISCIAANNQRVGINQCPHSVAIETLEVGEEPKPCVISVVLMAMLFSTPDFNALQILIESGRFDMREPLIFHLCHYYGLNYQEWKLIAVSPLGMALLLDRNNYKK